MSFLFEGNVNEDLNFEYGDEADPYKGCSATLFGEFWYFGSEKKVRVFDLLFES